MGRKEEGPGGRGAGCSESVQTVSSALCSTLHLRASRNVSVEGDDLYCFRSIFIKVMLFISYSIISLTGTDGRPIISKHTSVTGRQDGPIFVFQCLHPLMLYNREGVDQYPNINEEQHTYRNAHHDLPWPCYIYRKAVL